MSNRPVAKKKPSPPRPSQAKGSSSARVRNAQQAGSDSRRWFIVGVVAFVAVAALLIAVLATRQGDDGGPGIAYGTVSVRGEALPPMPQAQGGEAASNDPAVGMAAPVLGGVKVDGSGDISMPAAGKPSVLIFLAHWCPHCQAEVPVITKHLDGKLPTDVDLFGVSTGVAEDRPNFPPAPWLKREGWPVPTMADDQAGAAQTAYGLQSFPYFVAVDAQGKVVQRRSGELTPEQFDALLGAARGAPPQ